MGLLTIPLIHAREILLNKMTNELCFKFSSIYYFRKFSRAQHAGPAFRSRASSKVLPTTL